MNQSLTIETITPDQAAKLLEHNTENRHVRDNRVSLYASEMKAGRWLLTGEPIIMNGNVLLNGQHRLRACIEADVPFTTAVFRGADSHVYNVVDTGMVRTAGDTLHHHGIPQYNVTAAAARLVLGYVGNVLHDPGKMAVASSRQLILQEVTAHREQYAEAARMSAIARKDGYNASAFAGFVVILGRVIGDTEAHEWTGPAISGIGLEDGDPRLALRRWTLGVRKASANVYLSGWIRARNAYAKNEARFSIRPWFQGSAFPKLVEDDWEWSNDQAQP